MSTESPANRLGRPRAIFEWLYGKLYANPDPKVRQRLREYRKSVVNYVMDAQEYNDVAILRDDFVSSYPSGLAAGGPGRVQRWPDRLCFLLARPRRAGDHSV